MTASTPPVLPVKSSQPNTFAGAGTSTASSEAPVATPAIRSLISYASESVRDGLSQSRPWSEVFNRTAFSIPASFSEATFRIRKNYSYFRVNYLVVLALIAAFSLLSNPFSLLILLGLLASWMFLYLFRSSDQPLVILGRTFSDFEVLAILGVLTIVVVFLTNVGSAIISSLMIGVALVCVHGAFRVPEELFLDDQGNSQTTGFLSFTRGDASTGTIAAAVPPTFSARV